MNTKRLAALTAATAITSLTALGSMTVGAAAASGGGVTTVTWAASETPSNSGTGTLGGNTITYTTGVFQNSGETFSLNWDTVSGTAPAVGSGATVLDGGALGQTGTPTSQAQTITFTAPVTNPMLFVAFGDAETALDFGSIPVTLLGANNATASGSVVTFGSAASNKSADSFAVRLTGTFGPTAPLTFNYNNTSGSGVTVTFTLAFTQPTATDVTATTASNTPVTFNPLANDSAATGETLNPTSVELIDPATNSPSKNVTVAGVGAYSVDPTTGFITFTPLPTYTGTTPPITYTVTDSNGLIGTGSVAVTVAPVAGTPLAEPKEAGVAAVALGLLGFGAHRLRRRSN